MPKDIKWLQAASLVMKDTGILLVQHGDFPFDFIEKQPEMYHRIESIMQRLSEASKKLDHSPEENPHAADTRKLADMLRTAGYDVEIGYLDFALPTIADAVAVLKGRGHKKIIFANTPGFMMRSSHSLIDIPAVLETIRAKEPGLELIYAKPGGSLPLIARAIGKKINAALGESYVSVTPAPNTSHPGSAVVLVAHGDVPQDFIRTNRGVMQDAEQHAAKWFEMVQEWPRNEQNDPNYADTLVLLSMLRETFWPVRVEIGYLEFARPSMDEGFDRLVAAVAKRIVVAGGTGFFDRSSHTLIDIPVAIERLKRRRPEVEIAYVYADVDLVKNELARAVAFNIEQAMDTQVTK
jgi:sirohydrochlorin cobaltochelatase